MKKLVLIVVTVFLTAGLTANAQMMGNKQMQHDQGQGMMMQQGMMHHMNQQMPMQPYMMMVKMLPNMQEKLNLTQEQMEKLIDLEADFKKQKADYQAELAKKRMKLKSLLMEKASADEVKKQMLQCVNTKVDMGISAYETAGKMKALLTAEQKEKMKNMMHSQDGMMQQEGMMKNMMGQ